jgi:hypothetical protein
VAVEGVAEDRVAQPGQMHPQLVGVGVPGQQQQAGGVAIEAMHQAQLPPGAPQPPRHRILQIRAQTALAEEATGLVHHHQPGIRVDDPHEDHDPGSASRSQDKAKPSPPKPRPRRSPRGRRSIERALA